MNLSTLTGFASGHWKRMILFSLVLILAGSGISRAQTPCPKPAFANQAADITVFTTPNSCNPAVSYLAALLDSLNVSFDFALTGATALNGNGTGSGQLFNKGFTHVTVSATNTCGTTTRAFNVHVVDTVRPKLVHRDTTLFALPGQCGARVGYAVPEVTNNCPDCNLTTLAGLVALGFTPLGPDNGYFSGTGHYYLLTPAINLNNFNVIDHVIGLAGGHFVSITSQAEQNFIQANTPMVPIWIGLTDRDQEGVFKWTDGSSFGGVNDYSNFCQQQPDDQGHELGFHQNYVLIHSQGTVNYEGGCWDDGHSPFNPFISADNNFRGIMEIDICATSLVKVAGLDSNSFFPVGTSKVTYRASDASGNVDSITFNINVLDKELPTIICPPNKTIACGSTDTSITGKATAFDNCGIASITKADVSTRDADATKCGHYKYTVTRTWTATDVNGNSSTCTQIITVKDSVLPNAVCKPATVNLNATGTATITAAMVNDNSSDNCSPVTLSVSPSSFTCAQVNQNVPVTLTVKDVCNNTSTCNTTVLVKDMLAPTVTCPPAATIACGASKLPAATGTATTSDNCSATVAYVDSTTTQGSNQTSCDFYSYKIYRKWTATDPSGNKNSCIQVITVEDKVAPIAKCKNVSLTLVNGTATLDPSQINNGSSDACSGIATITASKTSFTCANIGANSVVLTVKDRCGNTSTCTSTVTIVGAACNCNITVTPCVSTYTGGVPTDIYLGYGPQKATLTASSTGSGPFTYQWSGTATSKLSCTTCKSPVFTPTAAGNFTFTVTIRNNSGCTSTCNVTFCVKDVRVPDDCYDDDDDDHNWSYDDDDDDHCYSKWSKDWNCRQSDDDDDDHYRCSTSTAKVYLCHKPWYGSAYTVKVSVKDVASHLSCHSSDKLGKCSQSCGTTARRIYEPEIVVGSKVKVYPNPTSGVFYLELPYFEKDATVTITDIQGKLVQQHKFKDGDDHKQRFDLGSITRGIYMVDVVYDGQRYRTKLVLQ